MECFPEDVWSHGRTGVSGYMLNSCIALTLETQARSFSRPPNPAEWERFVANAARVRTLTLKSNTCGLSQEDWAILALHRPEKVLFPNIKNLTWEDHDDRKALSYAHLLLGPKLRDIVLRTGPNAPGKAHMQRMTSLLMTLCYQRLPLRAFAAYVKNETDAFCDAVGKLVEATELETYDSDVMLTKAEVIKLAKSQTLKVVDLTAADALDINDEDFDGAIFPVVEDLNMYVHSLEEPAVRGLCLRATSPWLAELCISTSLDPSQDTVVALLEGLATRPNAFLIHSLDLIFAIGMHLHTPPPPEQPECILNARVIEALIPFKFLSRLQLKSRYLDVDDVFIAQILKHFPRIEQLLLMPTYYSGKTSKVSLRMLSLIAAALPCLKELGLPFDTSPEAANATVVPHPGCWYNQSCTKLHVADSRLADDRVEAVAVHISMSFWHPNLEIVAAEENTPRDTRHAHERFKSKEAWTRCQKLLRPLSAARYQERFRHGFPDAPWAMTYNPPLPRSEADDPRSLIPEVWPAPM